jgi:hypothetical protein
LGRRNKRTTRSYSVTIYSIAIHSDELHHSCCGDGPVRARSRLSEYRFDLGARHSALGAYVTKKHLNSISADISIAFSVGDLDQIFLESRR